MQQVSYVKRNMLHNSTGKYKIVNDNSLTILCGVSVNQSLLEFYTRVSVLHLRDLNHIEPSVSGKLIPKAKEVSEGVNWT